MRLNPGQKKEYVKRHDAIWPELKALLLGSYPVDGHKTKKQGVAFWSLFPVPSLSGAPVSYRNIIKNRRVIPIIGGRI